jgi:hypothetical protein
VWEKAKQARDATDKEERNVRRAKRASIRLEMARHGFIIVNCSDDETDLSDSGINDEGGI